MNADLLDLHHCYNFDISHSQRHLNILDNKTQVQLFFDEALSLFNIV